MRIIAVITLLAHTGVFAASALPTADRLITAAGVRLRVAPTADAAIVQKLDIGVVLPCTEQSAPVTIGKVTAPFCKTDAGWYFTGVTEVAETGPALAAQIDRLLAARAKDLSETDTFDKTKWPDVYAVHQLFLRCVKERTGDDKARAQVAELVFVAQHADAFHADPRVYRDESQGLRVKDEAFAALVTGTKNKNSGAADDAAWAQYQHGYPGECEGYTPCVLHRLYNTGCGYLAAVPTGRHANEVLVDIADVLASLAEFEASNTGPIESPSDAIRAKDQDGINTRTEARAIITKLLTCIDATKLPSTTKARSVLQAARERYTEKAAKKKL
jgi:hypothetical protein